jgi:hypothetical protein
VPIDQLAETLSTATTRRTIVKTGAKLAYAAPLVAVTMKLSSHGALAAVISGGPVCPEPGPGSSYALTCNVTQTCTDGVTTLSGTCDDDFQDPIPASIVVNTCQAQGYDVTNCHGVLVCGDTCP